MRRRLDAKLEFWASITEQPEPFALEPTFSARMKLFDRFLSMLSSKVDLDARYELLRETISGTMSSFFKARDRETGKVVGLKILDSEKVKIVEGAIQGM